MNKLSKKFWWLLFNKVFFCSAFMFFIAVTFIQFMKHERYITGSIASFVLFVISISVLKKIKIL